MEINAFVEHREEDSPNVLRVKALYGAFREKDTAKIGALLAEAPFWNVCPGFPAGGIYRGLGEIFGGFYADLLGRYKYFNAIPEVFLDGGDAVTVLGHYVFKNEESNPQGSARFAHIWGINAEGRIRGVWQVADSARFIQ